MNEQMLSELQNSMKELQRTLLINSLTNVANCELYPLEAREDAARRVQSLLGLAQTQNFVEEPTNDLPNNIIR